MAKRILAIDDEAHIVQVLALKLRNAGYDVAVAMDGEDGLDQATRAPLPDLIITDFQMPYMTGLELCRELAANPATSGIPVLMLTARGYALDAEDLAIASAESGEPIIRAVLSKPFSPRAVVEQIRTILDEGAKTVSAHVDGEMNGAGNHSQ